MEWFIAALAVVVLGVAAMAAVGYLGEFGPRPTDRAPWRLPTTPLTAEDIANLRFVVVPRGYAMEQVDEVLDRLQRQLRAMPGPADDSSSGISGIMEGYESNDKRTHDGSDETSYR